MTDRAAQRAIERTLNPRAFDREPSPYYAQLDLRDPCPAPEPVRSDQCGVCLGCRWVVANATREPWVHWLERHQAVPRDRRPAWRGCPDCNPDGKRPYREPHSGVTDPTPLPR